MDYSYYPPVQTPYQFLGFTPDSNGAQQLPQTGGLNGTTSTTNQHYPSGFEAFDHSIYDASNFVPPHFPPHRQSLRQSPEPSLSPSDSLRNKGRKSSLPHPGFNSTNGLFEQGISSDLTGEPASEDFMNQTRSSSEEKDSMTPAQTKRKAQNRAAQRAFRERKERHVKELEAKLNDLEEESSSLHDENERLKRELAKVATENEILRATSSAPSIRSMRKGSHPTRYDDEIVKTGPMKYTPTDFLATFRVHHSEDNESAHIIADTTNNDSSPTSLSSSSSSSASKNRHIIQHHLPAPLISSQGSFTPSAHRISISPLTGQRLLSSGATWDHIQSHPLFKRGLVDIAAVSERLKGTAECDGTGPAFEESRINTAIEESAALGRDELI